MQYVSPMQEQVFPGVSPRQGQGAGGLRGPPSGLPYLRHPGQARALRSPHASVPHLLLTGTAGPGGNPSPAASAGARASRTRW